MQGSTTLWESLTPATMDAAYALHHTTMRRVLKRHNGYECAARGWKI
jgi:class 3 adenylate cyclase